MALLWMISLLFVTMIQSSCFAAPLDYWTVQISNDMESRRDLRLRCQSKEEFLGQQNLKFGEEFSWRFQENLSQTTLYWCYMENQYNNFVTLRMFWPEADYFLSKRCEGRVCIWSARDDGVYLKNASLNKFELEAPWNIAP